MLKYEALLDARFSALADPTRRAMIDRLSRGPASVSELAAPFAMSLPAVVQHLGVLEGCGLVTTHKQGRVRTCQLQGSALATVEDWMRERRQFWNRKLDALAASLEEESAPTTALRRSRSGGLDKESP